MRTTGGRAAAPHARHQPRDRDGGARVHPCGDVGNGERDDQLLGEHWSHRGYKGTLYNFGLLGDVGSLAPTL